MKRLFLSAFVLANLAVWLTGCGTNLPPTSSGFGTTPAAAFLGKVHGGQQPVIGARVYLYAVSTQNGGMATSLLNAPGYTLTGLDGSFSIANDFSCPTGAYVYLLAVGGNPGLTIGTNAEIALAAGVGLCSSIGAGTYITVNEVSTVAFAYAVSGFATSDTQIGTTASLAAPFAYVSSLVDTASGLALPSQGGVTLPQQALNSLADAIAACVNSDGMGTSCSMLMSAANASPANTFQAGLKIAQNPGANVSAIYNLSTPNAVFQPTLPATPANWTLTASASTGQIVADANTYAFTTPVGMMCVELRPDVAPLTVANFRYYVNNGSYSNNMFLHRSVQGFVIQGGGYQYVNGNVQVIPTTSPVTNEYNLPNIRGTLAMATVSGDPNSATDQFFFNDQDNSASLNAQNGAYTVFGSIVGVLGYTSGGCASTSAGLAVMDAINNLPTYNEGSPFDSLPLRNYMNGSAVTASNLVITGISSANPQ